MKNLLLVDDNDKYARILIAYFESLGYGVERAVSAAEGLNFFQSRPRDHFDVIVTDITMESQLAGIGMLSSIHRLGYHGTVVVASTGFDFPTLISLSRLILKFYGVSYLVRKTTVLKNSLEFWPIRFFSAPTRVFEEIPTAV